MVLVRILGAVVLGYAVLVFLVQRAVAFPGQARPPLVERPPQGVRSVPLEASFGTVEAWYYAPPQGTAPGIVFFHGNGELIDDWSADLARLAAEGIAVLAVEFPGYGRSQGRPKRSTIRESAALAFDWLADRPEVDPTRIVAYGRSMGGGAASDLALDRPVSALVMQSTFASTMAMARMAIAPGFLVRDRWSPKRVVAEWDVPVLLMHGLHDEVIPYAQAKAVASARPGLTVTEIPCGHNDCGAAWPAIVGLISAFLANHEILG